MRNKSYLRLFCTGALMGVADLVPGVSGGTIALLLGVFDELVESIKIITGDVVKSLLKFNFKAAWEAAPLQFLVPLLSGLVIAIFTFVRIVDYMLENYPVLIWSLFFGLICGTVYIVAKRIDGWSLERITLFLLAAIGVYLIIGLPAVSGTSGAFAMFITGAIAICAMILPGISGSLIMLILGQYENVIEAVSELKVQLLLSFAVGAVLGLAVFSRLLSWLLEKYHAATLVFLTGLMVGALRAVWPWRVELESGIYDAIAPQANSELVWAIILVFVGLIAVLQLEKIGLAKEYDHDI